MIRVVTGALLVGLVGCAFDARGVASGGPDASPTIDAAAGPADAAPTLAGSHLLLSEIHATSDQDSEFIEIFNPTATAVALADYYLADDDAYPYLPDSARTGAPLPVDPQFDFVVRFPAAATIGPGAVQVVALAEDGFVAEFTTPPDYAITGAAVASPMIVRDGAGSPSLTDTGEGVALFYWDGASDRVADVDEVVVGDLPSSLNLMPDKTGLAIDGPDADEIATAYLADAATLPPGTAKRTKVSESYERIAPEGDLERASGGNGLGGHDETSEDTTKTWTQETFGPPTPGTVPAGLAP